MFGKRLRENFKNAVRSVSGMLPGDQAPTDEGRPLTPGETAIAKNVFGEAIDYSLVRINRSAEHSGDIGYVRQGTSAVFFGRKAYRDDFSKLGRNLSDTLETRAFFIHEMTHVWQNQTKCISAFSNLREEMLTLAGGDLYAYNPLEDKKFQAYRCEQQASMMQDFYAASGVAALDAAGVKNHQISYPMAGNWRLDDLASKILPVFPHFTVPAPL